MKKFLSKVLTLALVCAIVVTGTSITSEAKSKKSSKKAVATTYSSNAVVNDFVATGIKSNGLVIGGKSYNSQELITLGFAANPAVTVSPMYWQGDGTFVHDGGGVSDSGCGRNCGFYLYEDGFTGSVGTSYDTITYHGSTIYDSDITEFELNEMKAYGYTNFDDNARLSTNGVWNTDAFIANGINTQYICSWMQSRGLNTATDVYNYLVANGATFTVDTGLISNTTQSFVCVQCPNLYYTIDTTNGNTDITYDDFDLYHTSSGVNIFSISSGTGAITISNVVDSQIFEDVPVTDFYSGIQH